MDSWTEITDLADLIDLVGEPHPALNEKVHATLTEQDLVWLAASPLCFVGTSDAEGRQDVSPKGDPSGQLVHVIDERTIALAERPGNRRVDGYRNLLQNPQIGLNFVIPGRNETVRINGRARLVRDAPWFDALAVAGKRPLLATVVEIEEIFFHCARAFLRGKVWKHEQWERDTEIPEYAKVLY
ncbi:MSMEG_1061 family FMN-dependent PPOX-type flavoprotein [Nocardioides insulae]|uniref:MSMEG_1061 family FMN-dependent PPOX-type flavoprotein n=1 Tax=Nocardioides insulae TaxID=394734 RepID=UPI000424EC0E|nr:MSMEG_1061 family FMN-dependent PPOX-type flavoprotein [Nocardioides insulae]